jgi:prepilin-type N-terminal cleavage/methylation domain-containing protein
MSRRPTAALRRGQGGFTVIELIISMALIGAVFAIYSVTMSSTIRTSTEVQENSELQGEVRAAVEGIARDLRQAYTGNGSPGLETMTATQIQFLSPDRQTPYHLRRINYRLSSGELQRASATSTNTGNPPWAFPALSTYVTEVGSVVGTTLFTYYNAEGTQTTTAADVAGVKIKVTVANPKAPSRHFTYETSVGLRVPQ